MATTIHQVRTFDTTIQKTHEWLHEMCETHGFQTDEQAYAALRATLQTLRDRLTIEEGAHFAAQLPMLIRGFYYEGWRPGDSPTRMRTREEFLDAVAERLRGINGVGPQQAALATFSVLSNRITAGELADVRSMMPAEVRELWPEETQDFG